MNIKLNIITIALISLVLGACSDKLDLSPITEKAANNFYTSEQEIESAVIGAYAQLQNGGLYGLDLIGAGEISGEDTFEEIAANDGGRFGQLDDFSTNAGNDLVGDIWKESYEGIQRINIVLNRITDIEYENSTIKNNRIGEMKFLRGLLYFNLVRLYGGVPLALEETTNPSDYFGQGRATVSDIYAQIELDLNDAIQNLPPDTDKLAGRPAKGAAQALFADVQMNLGNYSEAVTILGPLVNSGNYSLMPSTSEIFGVANEGNSEILFEVQFASGVDGNNEGEPAASQFRPSGTTANAKGHNLPSAEFVALYELGDTRKDDYVGLDAAANPFYFSLKYEVSSTGADDGGSDHIIIRFADVLLKYAEALNESGGSNAAQYLNMVRNRAGLANTTATTQSELRDAIEMERRFEFIGEGHRWFDLKRTGEAIQTMNAWFTANSINVTIDVDNLILPIPQSQIDTDPAITPNPGY
ncbi:RagB/SusD family nutrient uptake outer membrane protein [Flavivirga spongiicola]|uniref:RagB/SusD family nutrient uptake outer membrane protein n=1 Tax=Flavivirga spongiicola TaxID=421621 RepID=A0ABU7XR32_9FLAO|nr:RagB/SusD family nutrient uptake outer membrane protein [Flavivirga sp. MEBiC05379]MDO5978230.1 RagB/SusD family nutrient uptake outer membrane protein [Flavivirga sp. MEBiC05379]